MKISREEVEHVARLARLDLSEEEIDRMTGQLDAILGYVAQLEDLDTTDIVPTAHAVPVDNVFRDDIVSPSLPRDRALQNAPAAADGCFRVPRVIE